MLTQPQLFRYAHTTAVRDAALAEKEVVLTYLLQLLTERRFIERIAFKGGTCIRKTLLGNRGRFSTDLDFTARAPTDGPEGEILELASVLDEPYHGVKFALNLSNEKEWRSQDGSSWAVYPTYAHDLGGGSIKFEVSLRETPILPIQTQPQLEQQYFGYLEFVPAQLPCLMEAELLAEKLRAGYQRRKARDIYDLAIFAQRPKNEPLVRKLLLLKLWNVRDSFDYGHFSSRLSEHREYDWDDLYQLIPPRDHESGETLLARVRQGFAFLSTLSEIESAIATDRAQRRQTDCEALRAECTALT